MKQVVTLIFVLLVSFNANSQQWELIESNTNQNLNSVYFPTSSVGYIAGDYGTMLKTTDGGSSWTELNSSTDNTIESVFFMTEEIGIAVKLFC